ncbi:MAG: aminotransferase [Lachnospiraceae bacterium]
MRAYSELSREELLQLKSELEKKYDEMKGKNLNLDMSRGKPGNMQLDLGMDLLNELTSESALCSENGIDCRNYGILDGILEAKVFMAEIMNVMPEEVIVCGNASLPIMYDSISRSYTHGVCGGIPWCKQDHIKFLCPAPGYDRHFAITKYFNIEMIPIKMFSTGPDMDMIEQLVEADPQIKGIWCIPKYSNPQGITYSDETVKRFAQLKPAASDFRIYWDNAYAIHHLYEEDQDEILDILSECRAVGNEDLVLEFASTSKVSFAGSGISAVATSKKNREWILSSMTMQTIGYDKINQLRHVRYFKNLDGLKKHMKKHADILRPKFEAVLEVLEKELGGLGIGEWISPKGGYFISFNSMEGCAKEIVAKCKDAGVILTAAGATFPLGVDELDQNIRIAPSYPSPEEMKEATDLFVLCTKLVAIDKLLREKQ